jgi:hypothetical protein
VHNGNPETRPSWNFVSVAVHCSLFSLALVKLSHGRRLLVLFGRQVFLFNRGYNHIVWVHHFIQVDFANLGE